MKGGAGLRVEQQRDAAELALLKAEQATWHEFVTVERTIRKGIYHYETIYLEHRRVLNEW